MCSGSFNVSQPSSVYNDPYSYSIDGVTQQWFCVLWYDGPLIWENEEKTHLMFSMDYTSQFETYEIYEVSNEKYNELIEQLTEDKKNNIRTNTQGTDVLYEIGILPKVYYSIHNQWEKLMPFDEDKLREEKPEIFI